MAKNTQNTSILCISHDHSFQATDLKFLIEVIWRFSYEIFSNFWYVFGTPPRKKSKGWTQGEFSELARERYIEKFYQFWIYELDFAKYLQKIVLIYFNKCPN